MIQNILFIFSLNTEYSICIEDKFMPNISNFVFTRLQLHKGNRLDWYFQVSCNNENNVRILKK